MPTQFKNKYEFWADLKTKMPQYADMDNYELADKILAKYPQYKSLIPEEKGIFGRIGSAIGNNITDITDVFDGKINKTPDQSGYIGNVIRSWWERLWRVWQNFSQIWSVKPKGFFDIWWFWSILWNAVQNVWEVAGWVSNDIIGGAFSGAVWTLASDKLKANTYEVGKDIAGTRVWQAGINAAWSVANKWGAFEQSNPEVASTLRWAWNIGMAALDFATLKAWSTSVGLLKRWTDTAVDYGKKGLQKAGKTVWKMPVWGLWETYVATTTGISRGAQQAIKETPDLYRMARTGKITREWFLGDVSSALTKRIDDLSDLGKWYESIRKSTATVPKSDIINVVGDYMKKQSIDAIDMTVWDRNVVKQALWYIAEYGDNLTAKNALSLRNKLDDLAKWWTDASKDGVRTIRGMRSQIDDYLKTNIPWLKQLDTKYAPERQFLWEVKKMVLNSDGSVKDNAISTIANITGKGKEAKLARLEKLIPWIEKRVKALKAFEEIQSISELKTWSVMRQLSGIAVWSSTWPVGAIMWFIATNPNFVARVLEAYGRAKPYIKNLLSRGNKISKWELDDVVKAIKKVPKKDYEKSLIASLTKKKELLQTGAQKTAQGSTPLQVSSARNLLETSKSARTIWMVSDTTIKKTAWESSKEVVSQTRKMLPQWTRLLPPWKKLKTNADIIPNKAIKQETPKTLKDYNMKLQEESLQKLKEKYKWQSVTIELKPWKRTTYKADEDLDWFLLAKDGIELWKVKEITPKPVKNSDDTITKALQQQLKKYTPEELARMNKVDKEIKKIQWITPEMEAKNKANRDFVSQLREKAKRQDEEYAKEWNPKTPKTPMKSDIDLSPIVTEAKKYKSIESFKKALKTKVWSKEVLNNLKPVFEWKSQREIWDILESIFLTWKLPTKKTAPQVSRVVDGIDLENIPF